MECALKSWAKKPIFPNLLIIFALSKIENK